jgi:hypothetical protein
MRDSRQSVGEWSERDLIARDDSIGFDLDEERWVDQIPHFDHRGRRSNFSEHLAVCSADLLPLRDVGHVDPRADHIFHRATDLRKSGGDVLESLLRLKIRVAGMEQLPIRSCRSRPRNGYDITYSHCSRVSNDRLPLSIRRNILSHTYSIYYLQKYGG